MLDETPTTKYRVGIWERSFGHRWTSPEFRALVVDQLDRIMSRNTWASGWRVVERYGNGAYMARLPRVGQTFLPEPDPFYERTGPKELHFEIARQTRSRLSISVPWADAELTSPDLITSTMLTVEAHVRATNVSSPT